MTPGLENPNRVHAWSYVLVQGIILALLLFLPQHIGPQIHHFNALGWIVEWVGILGVLVCAASLRTSLTVVPIPKESGELSTSGLYQYVRHPMYSSVLLFAIGIAIHAGSILKYLLVICLYILFHLKSVYEEKYLKQKYSSYAEYSARIPRFIPFTK